jgi:hypothetical protein
MPAAIHEMKLPICHESRDLGYARQQRRERRQWLITWALCFALAFGLWLFVRQMRAMHIESASDFFQFTKYILTKK